MSRVFQQAMYQLNIRQVTSSAYHPQSQGALERFHQTLKSMIRTYCFENVKDWDEGVHFLMFAARESIQESLGFSPFELVFGHRVRGPLKMLKEKWMCETEDLNILDYVCKFKYRLHRACEIARENLKSAQNSMKLRYDKRAVDRSFSPGNKVLVFLPVPNSPLHARYFGPYVIHKKVSDTDYIVLTPDRRKSKRLCHINMLKKYYERNSKDNSFKITSSIVTSEVDCEDEVEGQNVPEMCIKLQNSDVMSNLDKKLCHLSTVQSEQIGSLLRDFSHLFSDSPTRTNLVYHDVDVGDSKSIKQHPYRMNPVKSKHLRDEIQYMLKHDIIEPSDSEWSSPCILVPKPDGSFRFCTDYRKVNTVTRTDSYPIPRVDDCIDRIGNARFVTKFDLLKGYWEIPLTDRAKRVSAFVTPDGLFQYKKTFGGGFKKYCLLVFSHGDSTLKDVDLDTFRKRLMEIAQVKRGYPTQQNVRKDQREQDQDKTDFANLLDELSWRMLAIDNKTSIFFEKAHYRKQIVAMVDRMRKLNSPEIYTNDMFDKAKQEREGLRQKGLRKGWDPLIMSKVETMIAANPKISREELNAKVNEQLQKENLDKLIALKKKEEEFEKGRIAEEKRLQDQKSVDEEKRLAEEKERRERQEKVDKEIFQNEEQERQEIREREDYKWQSNQEQQKIERQNQFLREETERKRRVAKEQEKHRRECS
ncbi:hypothetical protein BSL78_25158 [Apostichopus japonicus]|uniref:Integrase catalytic domain-containing protein n=1 Tax=Stichopus japonicus TaxID=307972 RepID=A0A2G8JQF5_STIJA|nr:hypothetical protein BSL78_25158 [Apostichopus japonicus]